jgi:hypothetical protein
MNEIDWYPNFDSDVKTNELAGSNGKSCGAYSEGDRLEYPSTSSFTIIQSLEPYSENVESADK